ncbi:MULTISPECIES: hypothetical protein [unclassified Streptomyces]|uniref:hypothetical protein n=1 Tax=Streptomyces sp. SYP-A7185 TaxID=3040076 RepID=UPI0038F7FADF
MPDRTPPAAASAQGPIRLRADARTALRPAAAARITGGFWATRRHTNAAVSIARGPERLEQAGHLATFRAASSEVHTWLEAASWQLPYHAWAHRDEGAMRVWIPRSTSG